MDRVGDLVTTLAFGKVEHGGRRGAIVGLAAAVEAAGAGCDVVPEIGAGGGHVLGRRLRHGRQKGRRPGPEHHSGEDARRHGENIETRRTNRESHDRADLRDRPRREGRRHHLGDA